MLKSTSRDLVNWLAGGKRGISSNAMVQHLTGLPALGQIRGYYGWGGHPHDPSDLARCRLLLEHVPELVPELPRMASLSGPWKRLVEHWDELCALMDSEAPHWRNDEGSAPRTYKRMQALINDKG